MSTSMPIKTTTDELREVVQRMRDITELAAREDRELTAEERSDIAALDRRGRSLAAKTPRGESFDDLVRHVRPASAAAVAGRYGGAPESIGAAFTSSPAFQAIAARLPTAQPWRTLPVDAPFPRLQAAATLAGGRLGAGCRRACAGGAAHPDRRSVVRAGHCERRDGVLRT